MTLTRGAARLARNLARWPARARAERAAERAIEPGNVVVLLYHRVAELPRDAFRLAVTPGRFAEQLEQINSRFQVLRLTELAEALEAGELPRRAVVITFDDGYRDNLDNARPLLERYEMPATVFVASGHLGSSRDFWWDELELLCASAPGLPLFELWEKLKPLPRLEREGKLDSLWRSAGIERPPCSTALEASELKELARDGLVEIGGHTVSHAQLTALTPAEQRAEIQVGKERLEEILGRPIESFAFPYGDQNPASIACVKELGFKSTCAVTVGTVRAGTDAYAIPRIPVFNWRGRELARRLERLLGD
jgi:peptidoglycan/xylan/chitin deacetylase (PgdA/CDA1 family)